MIYTIIVINRDRYEVVDSSGRNFGYFWCEENARRWVRLHSIFPPRYQSRVYAVARQEMER